MIQAGCCQRLCENDLQNNNNDIIDNYLYRGSKCVRVTTASAATGRSNKSSFNLNENNSGFIKNPQKNPQKKKKKPQKNRCYVFFLNYTQIRIRRGREKPPGPYKSGETIGFGWHLQVVSKNCHHRFVKKKKKIPM